MTLLLQSGLIGAQRPRVANHPPYLTSSGIEAVELAASAGLILDPWQEFAVDVILGERADGKWAAREVAYLVARQNGKGGVIEAVELAALFLLGERLVLHSAHEFKTSKEAYLRIKGLIEGAPHLLAKVARRGSRIVGFRQSNEDTSIELETGARLRFMARSKQSGRGFSAQRLIVDEAQECTEATRSALTYIVSAQSNPQTIFTGTVPGPLDNGQVFKSLRNRGRRGGDPILAWLEWTPDPDLSDMGDRAAWSASNPALGYRIMAETIEAEYHAAKESEDGLAGFARERLSVWPDESDEERWDIVTRISWMSCASAEPDITPGWLSGPIALGIEVRPDRSFTTIAAAGECRESGLGVDIAASGPGVSWLVNHVRQLQEAHDVSHVVVDPGSPAGAVIADLAAAGIEVTECKFGDLVKATGDLYDAVADGDIVHRNHPDLNAAVALGKRRSAGDAWLVDRRGAVDTTPLCAAILARWGAMRPAEPAPFAAAIYA